MEFIKKDIPNWETKPHQPMNPKNWYKVYRKLLKESKKEVDQDALLLKATLDDIKSKQAEHKAKKVELNVVKPPKGLNSTAEVIKLPRNSTFFAREQNTKDLKPEYVQWEREHGPIGGQFQHPRLKAAEKSKAVPIVKSKISQFRKDAKAMSRFPRIEQNRVSTVSDTQPKSAATRVAISPAMLREYQKPVNPSPVDPTVKPPTTFNPKKRRIEHVGSSEDPGDLERREKRLRALTNPSNHKSHSPPSSSLPQPPHQPVIRVPRINRRNSSSAKSNSSDSEAAMPSAPFQPSSSSWLSPTTTQSSPPRPLGTGPARASPVPRAITGSPMDNGPKRIVRIKKAPVNPFMPQKRQRAY